MLRFKKFRSTDEELHQLAVDLRFEVFVDEQKIDAAIELEYEEECEHFLMFHKKIPIATARYRLSSEGVKLERFVMKKAYRGKGYGNDLMRYVLNDARKLKKPIYLNAQEYALGYYEKFDFVKQGPPFMEAEIRHYRMLYKPKNRKDDALSKAICRR